MQKNVHTLLGTSYALSKYSVCVCLCVYRRQRESLVWECWGQTGTEVSVTEWQQICTGFPLIRDSGPVFFPPSGLPLPSPGVTRVTVAQEGVDRARLSVQERPGFECWLCWWPAVRPWASDKTIRWGWYCPPKTPVRTTGNCACKYLVHRKHSMNANCLLLMWNLVYFPFQHGRSLVIQREREGQQRIKTI